MAMDPALTQAVQQPTMPSMLTYKQRCALREDSGALYNR